MIRTHQRTDHDLSSVSTDRFLTKVQFHMRDLQFYMLHYVGIELGLLHYGRNTSEGVQE
jgi:hypothetical protein